MDRGADVNATGGKYGTSLSAASAGDTYTSNWETAKLLLDRGADINLTGGRYGTALGAPAYKGKLEITKRLLHRGADPDLANDEGARPRDLAERDGHQAIVDLLDKKSVERKQ